MKNVYHLPKQISFPEGLTSDQRVRLQNVMVGSIRSAVQARTNNGQIAGPGEIHRQALEEESSAQVPSGTADPGVQVQDIPTMDLRLGLYPLG